MSQSTSPVCVKTIASWRGHAEHVYYPLQIFCGDFTGDGLDDALAWILYPGGGNSDFLNVALFRNEGAELVYHHGVDDVFGGDPCDMVFERGRITLTTTMPEPGAALLPSWLTGLGDRHTMTELAPECT